MRLIAITGGIGSGKSVVSRMVQVMGYETYDCDSRAKALMTGNATVRQQLTATFGKETYHDDGSLNTAHLSAMVFRDADALLKLNSIVHPATAQDMMAWAQQQAANGAKCCFVETALLRTAGLDRLVDEVWHVTAPTDVRINRVTARSGLTANQVRERIQAQQNEECIADGEHVLVNDNHRAVLPQVINRLLATS